MAQTNPAVGAPLERQVRPLLRDMARCSGQTMHNPPRLPEQCSSCMRRISAESDHRAGGNAWLSWMAPTKNDPCEHRIPSA